MIGLLAQPKPSDDPLVAAEIFALEIVQQPAPPADHFEQTLTGVMILGVGLEVFRRQMLDALGEDGDLDLG